MSFRKIQLLVLVIFISSGAFAQRPAEYIHQNGKQVNLKKKNIVFAKKKGPLDLATSSTVELDHVLDSTFHHLFGPPDFKGNTSRTCHRLDYKAEIVLSFNDRLIQNERGKDLFIFNVKEMNGLAVYISEDGCRWKFIEEVSNEKPFLNLKSKIDPQVNYKFIKLKNYSRVEGSGEPIYLDAVGISVDKDKYDYRWFEIEEDTLYLPHKPMHVRMRDKRIWDGDRVDVYVDESKFLKGIMISKICRKHELVLNEGIHQIKIRALSEGRIRPNTVQIEIIVDDRIYYKAYRLKKRRSAELVVQVL